MPKEIRGKLFTPNVHMDALHKRSLFSGADRALIEFKLCACSRTSFRMLCVIVEVDSLMAIIIDRALIGSDRHDDAIAIVACSTIM